MYLRNRVRCLPGFLFPCGGIYSAYSLHGSSSGILSTWPRNLSWRVLTFSTSGQKQLIKTVYLLVNLTLINYTAALNNEYFDKQPGQLGTTFSLFFFSGNLWNQPVHKKKKAIKGKVV